MKTFKIVDKTTKATKITYTADAPLEWAEFPFDLYDHIENIVPLEQQTKKYNGRANLTHLEFRSLFTAEELRAIDNFQSKFETYTWLTDEQKNVIRTDIKEFGMATFVEITNPKYRPGLEMYVQMGILSPHRIDEVLNG